MDNQPEIIKAESVASESMKEVIDAYLTYETTITLSHRSIAGCSAFEINRMKDRAWNDYVRTIEIFRDADARLRECLNAAGRKPRSTTAKQIALVHVAVRDLALGESEYGFVLSNFGRVERASDLDRHGFEWLLVYLRGCGFEGRPDKARSSETFGRRANMATPAQVELIRTLWLDWTGSTADPNDADLNAWLTKYQKVSALRFVDAAKAGKVIGALRMMVSRRIKQATAASA